LLLDRAGLVGGDGAVHHGFCDIALLRTLPGAAITAAIDEPSLHAAIEFMHGYSDGLSSVRYPRDVVSERLIKTPCPPFVLGKARCLTPFLDVRADAACGAPDVAVLAFGTPAIDALAAADSLHDEYRVAIYDARFAKPVDTELIATLLSRRIPIVTVEDHSIIGGFGAAILEAAQESALDASIMMRLGLPDSWILQDSRASQLSEAGIDAPAAISGALIVIVPAGRNTTKLSPEPAEVLLGIVDGVGPSREDGLRLSVNQVELPFDSEFLHELFERIRRPL
jgi:1-deoxy-D-xylulose-5-phosphate synthase